MEAGGELPFRDVVDDWAIENVDGGDSPRRYMGMINGIVYGWTYVDGIMEVEWRLRASVADSRLPSWLLLYCLMFNG